jgi:hypothetical protein
MNNLTKGTNMNVNSEYFNEVLNLANVLYFKNTAMLSQIRKAREYSDNVKRGHWQRCVQSAIDKIDGIDRNEQMLLFAAIMSKIPQEQPTSTTL